MKGYEAASRHVLPARMPMIIRVDGRAFHTYTRGLTPFSGGFKMAMDAVALELCREITNCKLAFVQSDEISLLLVDYENLNTQPYFGGVIQKIVSVTAATAAVKMTLESWRLMAEKGISSSEVALPCTFDSRVFVMSQDDVQNYFIWRQQDWTRNSIQMLARSQFSQKQCQGKSCEQLKDMLINEKKINWNDMATWAKRGRCYIKVPMMRTVPTGPKAGESIRVMDWYLDESIPIFTQNRDYINQLVYPMRMSPVLRIGEAA